MPQPASESIQQAKSLMNALQFSSAQRLFENALQVDPQSVEARIGLGRLALMRNEKELGEKYLDEVLFTQPTNAEALALKGISRMQDEDWQGAVSFLEKARKSDPDLAMVYFNLARSYRKLRNLEEAEKYARKAIELDANDYQSHTELSFHLAKAGKTKEALQELNQAIKINPLFAKGYLILANVYKQSGIPDLAIQVLNQGLSRNKNAIPLYEELSNIYGSKNDYRAAYRQALELIKRRNYFADYLRLGCYALGISDQEAATKAFRRAMELAGTSTESQEAIRKICGQESLAKQATELFASLR